VTITYERKKASKSERSQAKRMGLEGAGRVSGSKTPT